MSKFAVMYRRTTRVLQGDQPYNRTRGARHVSLAKCPLEAARNTFRYERRKRPNVELKILSIWTASADGWKPVLEGKDND